MLSDKSDYNKFKLYSYKVEDLINDYEQLKQLHEEIQGDYDELLSEELVYQDIQLQRKHYWWSFSHYSKEEIIQQILWFSKNRQEDNQWC